MYRGQDLHKLKPKQSDSYQVVKHKDTLFAKEVPETVGLWPYSTFTLFYICPRHLKVPTDVDI